MYEELLPLAQFLLSRTWVTKEQGTEAHDLTPQERKSEIPTASHP